MTEHAAFNPAVRYVRVIETRADGLIEFEFAVGEPQLFVELLMPRAQFDEFCARQHVVPTSGPLPEAAPDSDAHEWDWSLRTARAQRLDRQP